MKKLNRRSLVVAGVSIFVLALGAVLYEQQLDATAQAGAAEIRLYTGENFTGRELIVKGSLYDLPGIDLGDNQAFYFNDEIRSVRVIRGTWRLYQNGRCNTKLDQVKLEDFDVRTKESADGWSAIVSGVSTGELGYPSPAAGGFGGDISSVELISVENLPNWASSFRH